jgi:hypothetical protein
MTADAVSHLKRAFRRSRLKNFCVFSNIFSIEYGHDSRHDNPEQSSSSTTTTPGWAYENYTRRNINMTQLNRQRLAALSAIREWSFYA